MKILEVLTQNRVHLTAQEIYDTLRPEIPALSLGTVYRNLRFLADRGQVRELSMGSGHCRYEASREPHYHFMCRACGCVADLELPLQEKLMDLAALLTGGIVESHEIKFSGVCASCRKKLHGKQEENLRRIE